MNYGKFVFHFFILNFVFFLQNQSQNINSSRKCWPRFQNSGEEGSIFFFVWLDVIQKKNSPSKSRGRNNLFDLIWIQTRPLFCFVRWFFIKICFWLDFIQQKNDLSKSQKSVTVFTSFEFKRDHYFVFLGAFY